MFAFKYFFLNGFLNTCDIIFRITPLKSFRIQRIVFFGKIINLNQFKLVFQTKMAHEAKVKLNSSIILNKGVIFIFKTTLEIKNG